MNVNKILTVELDTFCNTGCEYCMLGTNDPNPADYDFSKIGEFLEKWECDRAIIWAGDPFYKKSSFLRLYNSMVTTRLKTIQLNVEAHKVMKYESLIHEIVRIANENGVRLYFNIGNDISGKKVCSNLRDVCQFINDNIHKSSLVALIRDSDIMDPEFLSRRMFEILVDSEGLVGSTFRFDISGVDIPGDEIRTNLMKAFHMTKKKVDEAGLRPNNNIFIVPKHSSSPKPDCTRNELFQISLDVKGNFKHCVKTYKENDISDIINIEEEKYDEAIQIISDYRKSFIDLYDKCNSCYANDDCYNCHKYFPKNFTEDIGLCFRTKSITDFKNEVYGLNQDFK